MLPGPATPRSKSFQSFPPGSASNTALPENMFGIPAFPSRTPDCCSQMSRGPPVRVNAPGDPGPVARLTVPAGPCRSSPDQFLACALGRPSWLLAHPWPAELQSPHFRECRKLPRAQKARPQPEGRCAGAADRSRIRCAEESSHPQFNFLRTLQQAHGLAVFRRAARSAPTSPFIRWLLRLAKNCLLRIKHNLAHAARRDQPKPGLGAIRQHFAQENERVSRSRCIYRNRRHQIVGYVLLYDHACNRGDASLLGDANLPRFQLPDRAAVDPTFQKPVQLGTFLVPKWARQFFFADVHQFLCALRFFRIPFP